MNAPYRRRPTYRHAHEHKQHGHLGKPAAQTPDEDRNDQGNRRIKPM